MSARGEKPLLMCLTVKFSDRNVMQYQDTLLNIYFVPVNIQGSVNTVPAVKELPCYFVSQAEKYRRQEYVTFCDRSRHKMLFIEVWWGSCRKRSSCLLIDSIIHLFICSMMSVEPIFRITH